MRSDGDDQAAAACRQSSRMRLAKSGDRNFKGSLNKSGFYSLIVTALVSV